MKIQSHFCLTASNNSGLNADNMNGHKRELKNIYINIYIQVVSRLVDITAGDDFLGLCDQKSSHKCVRFWTVTELWAFFNSRTLPRVNRVLRNQLAGDVLNLVAYRLRCKHYVCHVTRAVHNRAAACFAAGGGIFENQL